MTPPSRRFVLSVAVVALMAGWGRDAWTRGQERGAAGVVWDGAARDERGDDVLTPLDRKILEYVSDSQLEEVLDGTDPRDIYLSNGETLDALAARTQAASSRRLVFAPVSACRLLDTREAPEGAIRSGETRSFRVRAAADGYASQGGAAEGCELPGLAGMTLKANVVRAVALNVATLDVSGPGSLAIWPANRSEPEIGSVSFAAALAGGGVTSGVIVPVCDEAGLDPCGGGDLKIRAKISGAHVAADVVGYFHAAEPGSAPATSVVRRPTDSTEDSSETLQLTASARRAGHRSPAPAAPTRPLAAPGLPGGLTSGEKDPIPQEPALGDFPGLVPNPLGGMSKIKAVLVTGEGLEYNTAFDAHIENDQAIFFQSAYRAYATTGSGFYGFTPTGGRAFYGQTQDGYGVYGFDSGSNPNRGYGGYFYSTNGIGLYGYSGADRTHPNIYAPGVYGQSNQGVGVYGRGDTSNSHTFYNEGGRFEGGVGLYALGMDSSGEGGYGARIFSNNYRGIYVLGDTGQYDAYFGGDTGINTNGIVDRSAALTALAVNGGQVPIEPGDLVALAGMAPSPEGDLQILAVARLDADNRDALLGVAKEAYQVSLVLQPDGGELVDFSPATGPAPPQGYVAVVTRGLASAVKVGGVAGSAAWRIGDRLALSSTGAVQRVDGATDSISLGRLLSAIDPVTGTAAVYVDVD